MYDMNLSRSVLDFPSFCWGGQLINRNMHAVEDKNVDFINVIALFGICQQEFSYEYWLAISFN